MNDAFGAGLAGINSQSNGGHRCKGSLAYGATRLPGSQVARRRVFSSAGPAMRAGGRQELLSVGFIFCCDAGLRLPGFGRIVKPRELSVRRHVAIGKAVFLTSSSHGEGVSL
ncbi:MAG: hypothetical protein Q8M91_18225 [Polaromonas sp.]|nr:hypothetical protein [Polaromonas sp.]MDP3605008.1 hypothetical protein [Polaromonas sp.]